MRVTTTMTRNMVMACSLGLVVTPTKESTRKMSVMDMVKCAGQTGASTKGNGIKAFSMAMAR